MSGPFQRGADTAGERTRGAGAVVLEWFFARVRASSGY